MSLTPKQEAFCLAYLETGNASEAYRRSYSAGGMKPETINVRASELLSNSKIEVRISQLREPIAERHKITVDTLITELEEARQLALSTGSPAPAVSATMGKAKLLGMDKQVIEHTNPDGTMNQAPSLVITSEAVKELANKLVD